MGALLGREGERAPTEDFAHHNPGSIPYFTYKALCFFDFLVSMSASVSVMSVYQRRILTEVITLVAPAIVASHHFQGKCALRMYVCAVRLV